MSAELSSGRGAGRGPDAQSRLVDRFFVGALLLSLAGGTWTGCESSGDTVDPLEAEIEAAKKAKKSRGPAECTPGTVEPCYGGPEGSATRGVCQEGTRTCDPDGHWLECVDAIVPSKEMCNGQDDDCNGKVDDGFERDGTQCWNGQGECRSEGKYHCSADGAASTCDAPQIAPQLEVCDGKDNDCDGETDEGDVKGSGVECKSGKKGVCATGHKQCVGGDLICVQDTQPSIEICNKLDDDCDGKVDDDCVTAEEAAQAGG